MGTPIDLTNDTLHSLLEQRAHDYNARWLLAHADDGIIWGRFVAGALETAADVAHHLTSVPRNVSFALLRLATLQQVRIFGDDAETLIWRSGAGWQERTLRSAAADCLPEKQLLWGTDALERIDDWTLMVDGQQGLHQLVPLCLPTTAFNPDILHRPLRLHVHHSIGYTQDGIAFVSHSRLVTLTVKEPAQ